jgi:hypothetical protein
VYNFSSTNAEKSSKKKELKDRFLSGLPSRHLGDRKKKSFFASSSEEGKIWLGTCNNLSFKEERVDLSMCCCEKICAIDLLLCFALCARFVSSRSTVGVRLRLENYKNPLES